MPPFFRLKLLSENYLCTRYTAPRSIQATLYRRKLCLVYTLAH